MNLKLRTISLPNDLDRQASAAAHDDHKTYSAWAREVIECAVAGRNRLTEFERIAARQLASNFTTEEQKMNDDSLRNSKEGVFPDKSLRHLGGSEGSKAGRNFGHSPKSPPLPGVEVSPPAPGMIPSDGKQARP